MTEMKHSDFDIINAMRSYGGSFAAAIADAARCADARNLARLKAAFPDLWIEYDRMLSALDARRA